MKFEQQLAMLLKVKISIILWASAIVKGKISMIILWATKDLRKDFCHSLVPDYPPTGY